jgi:methyl-accepting chemotaxis protein
MLDNVRMGTKLIGGFAATILVAVAVAVTGVIGVGELSNVRVPGLTALARMDEAMMRVSIGERGLVNRRMMEPAVRQAEYAYIEAAWGTIDAARRAFDALPHTAAEAALWQELLPLLARWRDLDRQVVSLSHEKDSLLAAGRMATDPAIVDLDTRVFQVSRESGVAMQAGDAVTARLESLAQEAVVDGATLARVLMLTVLVAGALLATVFGWLLTRSILGPLRRGVAMMQDLARGRLGLRLRLVRRDEIGQLAQAMDEFADELQQQVVGSMQRIARGDLSVDVKAKDGQDEIGPALGATIDALRRMAAEMGRLSQAAVEGKLATRADAQQYQGDYRRIIEGVNATLDAVIGPLNVAAEYVDRISKGDIPARITDTYHGDFNEIKNNLNQCIAAVSALVSDASLLSRAAVDGQLATRVDAGRHQGDFRRIVEGVNATLDAVIGPLNVAAEYVDRISKGDIPPRITDSYQGDFNEIRNNLNQCIDAVHALVEDAAMLSQAAVDGRLATRADAGRHEGAFRRIVEGVNATLDAVIGPLNVAAEYVDRISKGDIPSRITDSYRGDFNELRNNLNQCIEAVSALVADAVMLSRAAQEGRLATRADAGRHQGDFQAIVQGVNATLDAVIGPLNVAAEYVDRISKGDIPPVITDSYYGDFNELKNNLNQCIEAVSGLVADAVMLSQAAQAGKLTTRADASRHQGDFQAIVQGVNATLDAVIGPLNVAAEYVDRISKGNIPPPITETYHGDFNELKNNLNQCIQAVNALVSDAVMLSQAAVAGKLATRADASRHQGDFLAIVQGVNATLDAVIGPLNVAAEYVDRISKGDIPPKITDTYNGDFNELKNNLNQCIEAVNALVSDAVMLSRAAVAGKLATRADASAHQGDFQAIVQGVNATLDAVIGPLNVAAGYVARISKGDIPPPITDSYSGDFNELKNCLNQCIQAVTALVQDAVMLSRAGVEGKLATRADAARHQGDFQKIVQGVNETLDAVIGPLNVAAQYVARISRGDIPSPITDSYQGDFNELKNNLNQCIEAVGALVADAVMLSRAAAAGRLATRADAARHQGDFQAIVQGVNTTLDAVIGPLNVAAEYVDRISKGDIPPPITDRYQGDFNELKNNLNQCIEAVNALVSDAVMLSRAAVAGKLATRADAARHQGDFQKIVQGVNATLDAVIGPLNVAAGYIDRISRGDIPPVITEDYTGDFNALRDNLNQCIEAVHALVADAGLLVQAAVAGKLATRADVSRHQGDFRRIVQGVNDTLDAVIGPLNMAAGYVDRISKGDIPPAITDDYAGDFNAIKSNLNTCVVAVNALVVDARLLSEAAVAGRLETRADASRHQGDFQKVVQGVNQTLDAVLEPINEAARVLAQVAAKDLTVRVQGAYSGDLARIKESLNTAVDNLDSGLTQVGLSSEQVSSAGGQISSGSQSLAEGASQQASSLEEISSSLEEMASMTRQNADNSDQAKGLAQQARASAEKGITAMTRMTSAIDKIKTSSDQTAKIVKTIDEIAFQTNLLALNAAVEAARAGEAGKGFAVVAEEVRNLAQRSAEAAKTTADMIEESVRNAEQGVEVTEDVAAILGEITDGAGKVNSLVAEIAAASREQSQGIAQVSSAVAQLDKVTQQNAANAEESASAAEELNSQAAELRSLIATFRLTDETPPRSRAAIAAQRRVSADPGRAAGHAGGRPAGWPPAGRVPAAPAPVRRPAPIGPPQPPPAHLIPLDDDAEIRSF